MNDQDLPIIKHFPDDYTWIDLDIQECDKQPYFVKIYTPEDILFIGAVVVNTQVPEGLRRYSTVIDFICGDFVHVRYLNDTGRDVIKKVPVDYFLVHWDLSWEG